MKMLAEAEQPPKDNQRKVVDTEFAVNVCFLYALALFILLS